MSGGVREGSRELGLTTELRAKDASLPTSPGRAVQPSGPPFDGHGGLERREIEVTHERPICSSRSVRSRASESLATEEKEEEKEELFSTSDQEKPPASRAEEEDSFVRSSRRPPPQQRANDAKLRRSRSNRDTRRFVSSWKKKAAGGVGTAGRQFARVAHQESVDKATTGRRTVHRARSIDDGIVREQNPKRSTIRPLPRFARSSEKSIVLEQQSQRA